MALDGGNNLRANTQARQFKLGDPVKYGFADAVSDSAAVRDMHPVGRSRRRRILLSQPITATQDYVQPEKVQRFIDNPRSGRGEPPWLVEHEGQTFVWDGHHRIAAALKRGQKSMTVRWSRPVADGG